jgi:hypothetical protein
MGFSSFTLNALDYNDVALLTLASNVSFTDTIRPICLSQTGSPFTGRKVVVAGWGTSNVNGTMPINYLREAGVTWLIALSSLNQTKLPLVTQKPWQRLGPNRFWPLGQVGGMAGFRISRGVGKTRHSVRMGRNRAELGIKGNRCNAGSGPDRYQVWKRFE